MSLLNQLFNKGLLGPKCKTHLNLAISRIKLLQNKRHVQLNQMRKEIAQFLRTGQEAIAQIRVEHIVREQNMLAAYEILELFCEFVLARVPILESQRECPWELQEAIASIIFAAPRCSDLPELLLVRNLFSIKYGKEFISAASELRPDASVNRVIIEKLSVRAPSAETKVSVMKGIAQEYNLEWDASKTEAEFRKYHEDLLDGSNKACQVAVDDGSSFPGSVHGSSLSSGAHPVTPRNKNQGIHHPEAPNRNLSLMVFNNTKQSVNSNEERTTSDAINNIKSSTCDVMEIARTAIASADRASAAARRAVELADIKNGPQIQEWKSSIG